MIYSIPFTLVCFDSRDQIDVIEGDLEDEGGLCIVHRSTEQEQAYSPGILQYNHLHVLAHLDLYRLNSDSELNMLIRKDVVEFITQSNQYGHIN